MIRFLRSLDLMDYLGNQNQINFCIMQEDATKMGELIFLKELAPSKVLLDSYAKSEKTDKDLQIFRDSYKECLNGFVAMCHVKGMVDLSTAGMDFNIVCNSSAVCKACSEVLSIEFTKYTTGVEVLF